MTRGGIPVAPLPGPQAYGIEWDSQLTNNAVLVVDILAIPPLVTIVKNGGGGGQGTCVYPTFAQSKGTFYWEIKWLSIADNTKPVGIGVCVPPPSGNLGDFAVGTFYAGLATSGVGGVILRPDGTVRVNGSQILPPPGPMFPAWLPAQMTGDVLGIAATIASDGSGRVNYYGVGGQFTIDTSWSTTAFEFNPGTFKSIIPCVVFDSAPGPGGGSISPYIAKANFGGIGASPFLGPTNNTNVASFTFPLGWPYSL